ncbi:MAG TPA: nucleotide pyrophosphohydrolase [Patescibacteria group bacterium]|nr:nucleotide pyrophosphohydrolase [Patescibacteria group bacterium]
MELEDLQKRALEIKEKYHELEEKKYGKKWTPSQIMEGFVGDVGDLMKLVMAKDGKIREVSDVDKKIAHELSDCLFSIFVLSDKLGINIENSFKETMDFLEEDIDKKLKVI